MGYVSVTYCTLIRWSEQPLAIVSLVADSNNDILLIHWVLGCVSFHVWGTAGHLLVRGGFGWEQWGNGDQRASLGMNGRECEQGKPNHCNVFQALTLARLLTNVPLAPVRPEAETRVRVGGHRNVTWQRPSYRQGWIVGAVFATPTD